MERVSAKNKCAFLDHFPLEIRTQIYEELLVNPILGTADSIKQGSGCGADVKYDLCPAVLRLCHQIHDEAFSVLYGNNTFYIACVRVDNHPILQSGDWENEDDSDFGAGGGFLSVEGPQVELCPLTRYENCESRVPFPVPNLRHYTSVPKVRNWRAVISRLKPSGGTWNPEWSLDHFCRSLCGNPPASLEVLILPCGLDHAQRDQYVFYDYEHILKPLTLLRNLKNFVIKEACEADVPDIIQLAPDEWRDYFVDQGEDRPHYELEVPASLKTELGTLVTSQKPIDLHHMMHKSLVNYAQAFERYRPFKIQMGLRREDADMIDQREPEYAQYIATGNFNPFISPTLHPVEYALQVCHDAALHYDYEGQHEDEKPFKPHRRHALMYLERQWTRIEEANRAMTEFVKEEKVRGGLFDVAERAREQQRFSTNAYNIYNPEEAHKICLAMVYLENYAASFVRETTDAVRAQIMSNRVLFNHHYDELPRDRLIKTLVKQLQVSELRHFRTKFATAVDMCDQQYLEILTARKKMFDWDGLKEFECDFDLKLNRSVEMIDWTVYEPNLTPYKPLHDFFYDGYGEPPSDEE